MPKSSSKTNAGRPEKRRRVESSTAQKSKEFVVKVFDQGVAWTVDKAATNDTWIGYEPTTIEATRESKQHWLKNAKLADLFKRLENQNGETVLQTRINGETFIAQEAETGEIYQIESLQILANGDLRIFWPTVKREDEVVEEEECEDEDEKEEKEEEEGSSSTQPNRELEDKLKVYENEKAQMLADVARLQQEREEETRKLEESEGRFREQQKRLRIFEDRDGAYRALRVEYRKLEQTVGEEKQRAVKEAQDEKDKEIMAIRAETVRLQEELTRDAVVQMQRDQQFSELQNRLAESTALDLEIRDLRLTINRRDQEIGSLRAEKEGLEAEKVQKDIETREKLEEARKEAKREAESKMTELKKKMESLESEKAAFKQREAKVIKLVELKEKEAKEKLEEAKREARKEAKKETDAKLIEMKRKMESEIEGYKQREATIMASIDISKKKAASIDMLIKSHYKDLQEISAMGQQQAGPAAAQASSSVNH